jgi:hypothetical protein
MKTLLIAKSVVEVLAGLALLLVPSTVVSLALGVPLELSGGIALVRFAGVILLGVGIACWMARNHSESRGAIGLIVALLVFDVSVVALLLLGPASRTLVRNSSLARGLPPFGARAWSLFCLRKKPR